MPGIRFSLRILRFGMIAAACCLCAVFTQAQTFNVLYAFCSQPTCADGLNPFGPLVQDQAGNLYGSTVSGGSGSSCVADRGCGTVFKLSLAGDLTVLHSFTGAPDGAAPNGGLVLDSGGNLYGTTSGGGTYGYGTVFELGPSGTETVLYNFTGGNDGAYPQGGMVRDANGNLFGVAYEGGPYPCSNFANCGTIFELTNTGQLETVWAFTGLRDDGNPNGGLILDAQGNLYGTTAQEGELDYSPGTVFEQGTSGKHKQLHAFHGGVNGGTPLAGLVMDAAGSFYGTTIFGGILSCYYDGLYDYGCGVVFRFTPSPKKVKVLHRFTGGSDGATPSAGLVIDAQGNLYGTAVAGGNQSCQGLGPRGCGVVFEIPNGGAETVLYQFANKSDGAYPSSGLWLDGTGNLYGVAAGGANNGGVLFKITR